MLREIKIEDGIQLTENQKNAGSSPIGSPKLFCLFEDAVEKKKASTKDLSTIMMDISRVYQGLSYFLSGWEGGTKTESLNSLLTALMVYEEVGTRMFLEKGIVLAEAEKHLQNFIDKNAF